ncbi:MAG TPA: alternative ribosome rescue aminoacyl-tRNA hydrolase ArfB [Acidobacteriota bacterium]|nr:aminoacyl-tRNA hydrolase [Acidobacteriota bacterium]HOT00059.1 alternative ribosome rescue aminoacyl-tRNA hydrolase ArfB [Acidobacteriota bacterium]HQF86481.1 alternative ribosome rescue aminoacyl-tRNA hydrolase ArfB [Acidobacteriota bacterium]HQG90267.1 alternative ribosome rescue aminoacyl-tRNA hydrolase ArfB [Acidobacteriota bacterium]
MIQLSDDVFLDEAELTFTATPSSGPGGQHVNKASTRVTVRLDVAASASLSEAARRRIQERLASRMSRDGVLFVSAQDTRSQKTNRDRALARLVRLLRAALREDPPRIPTPIPPAARRRRQADKRRRSAVKAVRRKPPPDLE